MQRRIGVLLLAVWCLEVSIGTTNALVPVEQTRRRYFGDSVAGVLASGITTVTATGTVAPVAARAAAEGVDVVSSVQKAFPVALSNDLLLLRVALALLPLGFKTEKTLVASSLCSDEVNRPLEETFRKFYGDRYFAMGGLAGFPFSGVTGFSAMASHIPDGGDCLLVYGPHVGVDSGGNVGKVDRRGKNNSGTCCGSAVAASKYLQQVVSGDAELKTCPPSGALDAQQAFVSSMLLPYASDIIAAKEPMVKLPYSTFKPIDNMMNRIVGQASSKVGPTGRIAMLGGLQINTPDGTADHFLPLRFDVRDSSNKVVKDLLDSVNYAF